MAFFSPKKKAPVEGLVVSLTSFPERFSTLSLTLKSLFMQANVRPEQIVLFLAKGDADMLPGNVLKLRRWGLKVREVENDYKSYNKLIHALQLFPNHNIVTVDDDVCYPAELLQALLKGVKDHPGAVVCWRGHEFGEIGPRNFKPYSDWSFWTEHVGPSNRIWFTGKGGVLYSPGSLCPAVNNADLFLRLAPTADDVWFNWMARMANTPIVRSGGNYKFPSWKVSQQITLSRNNSPAGGGNDKAIIRMAAHFGQPWLDSE